MTQNTAPTVDPAPPRNRATFTLALLVLAGGLFLTGQSFDTPLHESFTQTADEMEETARGGDTLRRVAFLGMGLFGAFALAGGGAAWPRPGRVPAWGWCLTLYVGWCAASVLWSHEPGLTVRRLIVLGCFLTAALGVARALTNRQVVWLGALIPAVYLGLGVLTELVLGTLRPWAGGYRFGGTMHPNTQGICLVSLCTAAAVLLRDRSARGAGGGSPNPPRTTLCVLFAAGLLFLVLTKSRTSFAGVGLSLGVLAALASSARVKLAVAVVGGTLLGGGLLAVLACGYDPTEGAIDAALMGRKEQVTSLTGRTAIWEEVGRFTVRCPSAGWGYDSFWTPDHIATVSENCGWGLREAHSAYRDVLLSVGRVGLALLLAGLVGAWVSAARRSADPLAGPADPLAGYAAGFLAAALLNGLTESAMTMVLTPAFLASCVLCRMMLFDPHVHPARRSAPSLPRPATRTMSEPGPAATPPADTPPADTPPADTPPAATPLPAVTIVVCTRDRAAGLREALRSLSRLDATRVPGGRAGGG